MSATHVLSPYLIKTLPFNPLDDFTPIAMLGTQGYVVIAGGGQPFRSLHDLTDYAHVHPDSLSVGTTDMTTLAAAESIRERIGVKMTTIPYKGGGPLVTDVIGGQVSIGIVSPSAFLPMAKDSRLNGLAVTAPARFAALPAVPTVAEASGKPGIDVQNWFILAGPAKMPADLVQRLHAEIVKILADPEMRKQLNDNAIAAAADLGTPAMLAMMKDYQQQVGKLLVAAGVTPE
jgi:tripartite-type tricarboxylate transporter receptor subunit TctC